MRKSLLSQLVKYVDYFGADGSSVLFHELVGFLAKKITFAFRNFFLEKRNLTCPSFELNCLFRRKKFENMQI